MSAVSRFCDRAVLLEQGDLAAMGQPDEIAEQYLAMNFSRYEVTRTAVEGAPIHGTGVATVREVWFEDEYGQTAEFVAQGRPCTFKARIEVTADVEELGVSLAIDNDNGLRAFTTTSPLEERRPFRAGEIALVSFEFQNDLVPGWRYHVTLDVESGPSRRVVERRERVTSMVVTGARLVLEDQTLEHRVRVEPERTTVA
jgi:hypothetical protein